MLAHVAGMPVEEVAVLLASSGIGTALVVARVAVARTAGRRQAGHPGRPR